MINKRIKLVNVIQVMLVHWILSCQCQTCHLWEFDPAKHQTLLELFGTTHEDIWKVLLKANEARPDTTEDHGHDLTHPASPVSFFHVFKVYPLLAYSRKASNPPIDSFMPGQRGRSGLTVRLRFSRT